MSYSPHVVHVRALFRQSLRTAFDWSSSREGFRQSAIHIRYLFEEHRNLHNPKRLQEVIKDTEAKLAQFAHPEPYRYPTSPFGSKYERNLPVPDHVVNKGLGDYHDPAITYGKFERNFVNVD
ncbi:hypothetical protein BCR44DRAFT_62230 [Catenaria anguillulae PL171]|uniref:NADH dehydrogenase [ubiquinone] 1 beta subcomplex subunit 9 n=1 Tax=Catenaria anguillulae PL171 TaxID=765915 RepID=A0A1Y2HAQ3_9FUNG|nr:hypothetical protein BCR44DRAFT_62230 [Catenaria anguillulae PL171]